MGWSRRKAYKEKHMQTAHIYVHADQTATATLKERASGQLIDGTTVLSVQAAQNWLRNHGVRRYCITRIEELVTVNGQTVVEAR
jgi:hypothetical protein